jgi:hypothetical protein
MATYPEIVMALARLVELRVDMDAAEETAQRLVRAGHDPKPSIRT